MVIAISMTVLLALSALASVAMVGKPRTPLTGGVAVAVVVIQSLLIWGIWHLALS